MEKSSKNILIAEDDPFLSKIITSRITEEGFAIDHASDGGQALAMMQKKNYSLLLLDLIMPNKNGFEVLAELKKKKAKLPVLVFTNLAQKEDEKEVLSLGAKGYYVKSDISIDDLVKTVKKYL
jgi:DNA-binding response OmpR family regulator